MQIVRLSNDLSLMRYADSSVIERSFIRCSAKRTRNGCPKSVGKADLCLPPRSVCGNEASDNPTLSDRRGCRSLRDSCHRLHSGRLVGDGASTSRPIRSAEILLAVYEAPSQRELARSD